MPYNKGDFTQQGVAGHVNANIRLNEKRLVNIDLTSNEEAEGCTISGAVTDLLNNEVYSVGAGVSGNIEITENGENINVAPFATATVNVSGGGGDNVHYCTVTLIPTGDGNEKQITIDQGSNKIVNGSLQSAESEITTDTIVEVPHFSQTGKDGVTVISTYPLLFFRSTVITSTSNAVNCEWNSNDECIYITDPSENSSITINGTMLK